MVQPYQSEIWPNNMKHVKVSSKHFITGMLSSRFYLIKWLPHSTSCMAITTNTYESYFGKMSNLRMLRGTHGLPTQISVIIITCKSLIT